jgi:hypothetical protein
MVSLNPQREPAAERVIAEFDYAHPIFDAGGDRGAAPTAGDFRRRWRLVLRRLARLRFS